MEEIVFEWKNCFFPSIVEIVAVTDRVLNLEVLAATESTTFARRKSLGVLKCSDNTGFIGMSCKSITWGCAKCPRVIEADSGIGIENVLPY